MQNRLGRATLILAVIGFLCMAGVMFWVFSQHGSIGLYNWNYDYRSLFNYLWALTFAIPASVLLAYGIRRKSNRAVFNLLKIIVVLLSLAGIGVSLYAGLYGIVIPAYSLLPSYEPVLMVEPHNGVNGIPNLYVHFVTSTPTQVGLVWGTEQTSSSVVEEQPVKQHVFRLSDLQPGQTYFYALNNGPKRWFKTPTLSSNATLTVFAVAADAHAVVRESLQVSVLRSGIRPRLQRGVEYFETGATVSGYPTPRSPIPLGIGSSHGSTTTGKLTIVLKIGSPYMTVNGVRKEIDPGRGTVPITVQGRTLLPIRAIVEAMGGTVGWDGKANKVTIKMDKTTIVLTIGKKQATVNGKTVTLDVAPQLLNDRTMVPLRFVAESLGAIVEWEDVTQTVTIRYGK